MLMRCSDGWAEHRRAGPQRPDGDHRRNPEAEGWQFKSGEPPFNENPAYPDRTQPYREFVIHYHELNSNNQGFPQFNVKNGPLKADSLKDGSQDGFAINYGIAGIGPEILANRLGVGPMGSPDSVELKFEEFFLSSWAVGDPAMVVDVPADANAQVKSPTPMVRLSLPTGPPTPRWRPEFDRHARDIRAETPSQGRLKSLLPR